MISQLFSIIFNNGPGQTGESSPPLPYLGRRAGLVRNAIIASHRQQLYKIQLCDEDSDVRQFLMEVCKTKVNHFYSYLQYRLQFSVTQANIATPSSMYLGSV